jgi:hypothetical protein
METATIAQLQAEIARLKQLLEVLIVENAEIKANIAYLKSCIGIPEVEIANPKSYVGNPEQKIANSKTYIGNSELENAHLKSYNGNTEQEIAHPKSYVGNTEPLATLPEIITEQSGIKNRLQQLLTSKKVAGSNRQAIAVSAALIVHIYNKKPCDYKTLKKITALSQFGLAKRIRALKKDGLIMSSGYQSFGLTNSTLQLLQRAVGG